MRVNARILALAGLVAAFAAPVPASAENPFDRTPGSSWNSIVGATYSGRRERVASYDDDEAPRARRQRSSRSARRARQVEQYVSEDDDEAAPRSSRRNRSARRATRSRSIAADEGFEVPARKRTSRRVRVASYGSDYLGDGGSGTTGVASFYWQPQRVASGGWFNPNAMTAAHKTLPFGTRVRVTHLGNGRSVVVTINDRGPYIAGRIIDLSKAAAGVIGMQGQGVARIRMTVLGR